MNDLRGKESDNLSRGESGIGESIQDFVNSVEWLRNEQIGRSLSSFGTTEEEVKLGSTRAVRDTNGTSELNAVSETLASGCVKRCLEYYLQVTGGDIVLGDEGFLDTNNVINTAVGVEGSLDGVEGYEGTVSSTTAELALLGESRRETNGIVESETERLVHFLTTLATIEEVFLNIIKDREEHTAGCVSSCTTIRASRLANECSYEYELAQCSAGECGMKRTVGNCSKSK